MSKPKIYLTRREQFSTANRLHCNELSDADNERIYGPCNNKYGYGHNYILDVTICGPVDPKTGLLMHLTDLKNIIHREILDELDHKHIDYDVDYFKETKQVSSIENLCVYIWNKLQAALEKYKIENNNMNIQLYEIKIAETNKNSVFYRGE